MVVRRRGASSSLTSFVGLGGRRGCQLRALPDNFGDLQRLTDLAINNNLFDKVPEPIYTCRMLRKLYMSSNRIKQLPARLFACLPELRTLGVAKNQLTWLPTEIGLLSELRELNVSSNRLLRLPDELALCTNLKILNISSNPIAALPTGFHRLARLQTLTLNNMPLLTPPPNVVAKVNQSNRPMSVSLLSIARVDNRSRLMITMLHKKGIPAVRQHLLERDDAAARCLRIKVLLVGRENVGKTSVARALARVAVRHTTDSTLATATATAANQQTNVDVSSSHHQGSSAVLGRTSMSALAPTTTPQKKASKGMLKKVFGAKQRDLSTDGLAKHSACDSSSIRFRFASCCVASQSRLCRSITCR